MVTITTQPFLQPFPISTCLSGPLFLPQLSVFAVRWLSNRTKGNIPTCCRRVRLTTFDIEGKYHPPMKKYVRKEANTATRVIAALFKEHYVEVGAEVASIQAV